MKTLITLTLWLCATVAQATNIITYLQPGTNVQNYPWPDSFRLVCAEEIEQEFTWTIKGEKELLPREFGYETDWTLPGEKQLAPKKTYQCTLESPTSFIFHGKKVKEISWTFTTASADILKKYSKMTCFCYKNIDEMHPIPYSDDNDSNHFKIEPPDDQDQPRRDLTITLFATLNGSVNPEADKIQLANYLLELKQYKQEALNWLIHKKFDPKWLRIKWVPDEAKAI